jgi:hypothetical protein
LNHVTASEYINLIDAAAPMLIWPVLMIWQQLCLSVQFFGLAGECCGGYAIIFPSARSRL